MATIHDVAKRAGVSAVTVSRVLNQPATVSAPTQAKVLQAIDELSYMPSSVARSLRVRYTRTLALMVPDITNSFWTTVARGVEDAAQARAYSVFLCNTDENPAKQLQYIRALVSQQVDGVIFAPYASEDAGIDLLRQNNVPTVAIDRCLSGWDVDTVMGDSVSGAHILVKHLIDLGHRRIAVLSGPAAASTARDRVLGYLAAHSEAGLPIDSALIHFGEYRSHSGEQMTRQVLRLQHPPTAIFAGNNLLAMGVIDAVSQFGLRVPDDLALVCFDDLTNTSHLFPFLTVVVQPAYEMGSSAAGLLLSRLDGTAGTAPCRIVLPTRMLIRYSCGSQLRRPGAASLSVPAIAGPVGRESPVPNGLAATILEAASRELARVLGARTA